MRFVSLDHNATTDPYPQVIDLVGQVMAEGGNPSAVHARGRAATGRLETARRQVASLCGGRARDVTFFGSATEAQNALIHHFADWDFLRPATEHAAILAPREGRDLQDELTLNGPTLLCIALANNETGLINDIPAWVAKARAAAHPVHIHVDAVQGPGKLPLDFTGWGIDSLAISAHKMGGPQGVGALMTRPGFDLTPQIVGGGQERRRRAGTENVAGIAGFGLACQMSQITDWTALQTRLESGLLALNPDAQIVGQGQPRLTNTTCLLTPGKGAETMLMQFDLAGLGLSSGSACSSGKVGASHVLTALGFEADLARSALRFSFGRDTTADHIDRALEVYGDLSR